VNGQKETQRFEVVLTGAFLTGRPLKVRVAEYSQLQRDLGEELTSHASGGWDYESIKWRDVPSYKYGGGGYSSLVPLVLVQRNGEHLKSKVEDAQRACPGSAQDWLSRETEGWIWELRAIRIQLYDLGVGVIAGVYEVATPPSLDADAACRTIESLSRLRRDPISDVQSPVSAAYKVLAQETVDVYSGAVARCVNGDQPEPWLTPLLRALPPASSNGAGSHENRPVDSEEWGRLLWLHPVFVLGGDSNASSEQLIRIARPFKPNYSQPTEFPRGIFIPGIDSSAIVVRGEVAGQQEIPMNLIELHWAYYALFMEMDRGLLATLDNDKWQTPESLPELEADAERIFRIYMRVREARARLDSALTDLGGGQLGLWKVIADVTKFEELVASVEGKVEVLQRVAEHRVQQAAAARARKIGNILSGLTALTVVTVVIALVSYLLGGRTDRIGHVELRILTILAALLLVAALTREQQREIAQRLRRTRLLKGRTSRPDSVDS
jgi:hypothetical protein